MPDNSQTLSCVMIPVSGRQLLLPNVSIAEVVDFAAEAPGSGTPHWLIGRLSWRGLNLPVLSYDAANGSEPVRPGHSRGRIVVLNTIGRYHDAMPFMALVTQGIPSQTRISEADLRRLDGENGPADLMQVDILGETAWIPDLEYLESLAWQVRA